MKSKDNRNEDELEVLVDLPTTDKEAFMHILSFGRIKPIKGHTKMSMREYKSLQSFVDLCLAATIFISGVAFYQVLSKEVEEQGSLKNAYNYQMELLDKMPLNGLYP